MAFAHNVDPASEDNEANRELILNPPPLEVSQIVNEIGLDGRHVIDENSAAICWRRQRVLARQLVVVGGEQGPALFRQQVLGHGVGDGASVCNEEVRIYT